MKFRRRILATLPLALLLAGCSDSPKPAEKAAEPEKKAAAPVTGLSAVYKMYTQARSWAPDCKLLRVGSLSIKEVKNEPGKAGAWEATFVSESQQKSRRYTFSAVESPSSNLHEGVFGGSPDSWTQRGQAKPFPITDLKIDTPAVLEVAMKNKGTEYSAKHPEIPVTYLLELTSRFPVPAWRAIWGESVSTSGFSVFVDAAAGGYLEVGK